MTIHAVAEAWPRTEANRRVSGHSALLRIVVLGASLAVGVSAMTAEMPFCPLADVTITLPNGTVTAASGGTAWVSFLCSVTFNHSTACTEPAVVVSYRVNGVVVAESDDRENGFLVLRELPVGNYAVTATATVPATGKMVSSTRSFMVRDWPGLADCFTNPFACLTREGDRVTITVPTTVCLRTISMVTWFEETPDDERGTHVTLTVENPVDPNQVATVSVPRALLEEGEQGVLLVAVSCDLDNLLEAGEAGLLPPPPDYFVEGGTFFEASVLVRGENDDAFEEIDSARLETWPVRLSLTGLTFSVQRSPTFFAHPSEIACDGQTGVQILAAQGGWQRDMVSAVSREGTTLHAETSSLSVFGPFEIPQAPTLQVVPDPSYDYIVGIVNVGCSTDSVFRVTNVGNSLLTGSAELDDPEGMFSITSASEYSLTSLQNADIVVRFSPREAKEYTARLTLSGGYNGPFTMTLRGTGSETKRAEFMGCGDRQPSAPGGICGDAAVVALTVLFLLMAAGRARRVT